MMRLGDLELQLRNKGCNYRFWGRAEIKELAHVLLPTEKIENCVNGAYEGGFAMLCVTDQRVLLIDKKPLYLTLEDIRFDMIAEVDYNHSLTSSTINVYTPNRSLRFTAFSQGRLRKMFTFIQQRVMDVRQYYAAIQHDQAISSQTHLGQPGTAYAAGNQNQPAYSFLAQQHNTNQVAYSSPPVTPTEPPQSASGYSAALFNPLNTNPHPNFTAITGRVAPIISAYTRLPHISRQRRNLGSRVLSSITGLPQTSQILD